MKLIFLGPPGAGKGTQAKMVSEKLSIPHVSTGDIFRDNISRKTPLGVRASGFMNKGMLVPDEVTNDMVEQRLKQADCREGYVLDGYPRTINQAEFLDKIQRIDHVIDFALDEKNIIMRISGRRTCSSCQSSFHNDFKPPKKSGICDQCGGGLVQREDERPQVVKNRLMVYQKQTAPLIDYYKRKKLLVEIDASPSIKDIHAEVMRTLT